MNIAFSLNPKYWRFGRWETYDVHPTTGREIVQNVWWCLGPVAVSFDDNDPWAE